LNPPVRSIRLEGGLVRCRGAQVHLLNGTSVSRDCISGTQERMITLTRPQLERIFAHAKDAAPSECCGLIGGGEDQLARTIYQLHNVAPNANVAYEAAPEDLFAAQRQMRERDQQLLGIYHSHPRSVEPFPSEADVRLAYYPQAIYFIVGLAGAHPVMSAFRISERDERWEQVEYAIADE
jgi:proteasome lid subunit RPN8/RPN11